jgi:dTDP-4-dehydrorhamnose 3,5-epimerase
MLIKVKTKAFSNEFNEVIVSEGVNLFDERGQFKKTIYGKKILEMMGRVNELLCIKSNKNVIRGLHFQDPPEAISKFITCIDGKILDVFLDIRTNSNTYGKYGNIVLEETDNKGLFIPKGFAHGYSVLSDTATVVYLQSGDFSPEHDGSINPLSLDIDWKVENPLLSEKDISATVFKEFKSNF